MKGPWFLPSRFGECGNLGGANLQEYEGKGRSSLGEGGVLVMERGARSVDVSNLAEPLPREIARHPILKVTCKHFALSWSHC